MAGKVFLRNKPNAALSSNKRTMTDQEKDDFMRKYESAKKFLKALDSRKWKLARAGTDKNLLIGKSRVFKIPGKAM